MAELEELQPFESELLWARYQWRQVVYQELAALEPGFQEKDKHPFKKIISISSMIQNYSLTGFVNAHTLG